MITASVISTLVIPLATCIVALLEGLLRMRGFCRGVAVIGGLTTAAAGGMLLFVTSQQTAPLHVAVGSWFSLPGQIPLDVALSLVVDHTTAWLVAVVTTVGGLLVLYSVTAPVPTASAWRMVCRLSATISATVLLLLSGDFLQLIAAWQLMAVTVCGMAGEGSADLRRRMAVRKSALALSVGGCGLLLAACIFWGSSGSLDFAQMLTAAQDREFTSHETIAGIGILIAAIAGCAQFPLWVWLPDAGEESPTAAAGLQCVASGIAGIYLLLRFQTFLAQMPGGLFAVAIIGGGTAFTAGWIAATQTSRARLLAFVTIAQMGLIWLAVATGTLGGIVAAVMHLATLSTGMAVACLAIGGTRMEKTAFLCAIAGLCGVPLLSGFWSLTAILSVVKSTGAADIADSMAPVWWSVLFWCAAGSIFLTTNGLFRLVWPSRLQDTDGRGSQADATPLSWPQQGVLLLLAATTIISGAVIGPLTGWLPKFLAADIAPVGEDRFVQIVVTTTVIGGVITAWLARVADGRLPAMIALLFRPVTALGRREFFVSDYYFLGVALPLRAGSLLCRFVDWFIIDRTIIGTFARLPVKFAKSAQPLQNGLIQFYALMILAVVAMIFAVVLWSGSGVP